MTIKLTREEAIQDLKAIKSFERYARGRLALDVAIEALERERTDEWCDDCKEYDTEKKCCPRFNKVIREAMKRVPHEDGTLEVKVEDATKVGRVLVSDDEHRGGLYYPDEDEPQGISFENDTKIKSCSKDSDLISRTEAIEAITETLDAIDHVPKWVFDKLTCAINILPSADRPRGEWIDKEELIDAINDAQFVYDSDEGGHKEYDITELVRVIFKDIISNLSSADMRGEDK